MFNLQDMFFLEASNKNKARIMGKGVMTLVNAHKTGCGKRLIFSKQLQEDLQITDTIQIAISNSGKYLYLGKFISEKGVNYKLRTLKKDNPNSKLVLYNSAVVEEITNKMKLSFEDTVSVTFKRIHYLEEKGMTIAKIWIGEEDDEK